MAANADVMLPFVSLINDLGTMMGSFLGIVQLMTLHNI